ncbi:MAG: GNAT family N-acyltransferase [Clostridia bacterium]
MNQWIGAKGNAQAQTEAEKEAIYQLRYQVYIEELGKEFDRIDHENKRLVDALDGVGKTILFYAKKEDEIIGTVRLNIGTADQFPQKYRDVYKLDFFQQYQPEQPILAVGSRMFISAPYRKGKLYVKLIWALITELLEQRIPFLFLNSSPEISHLYTGLGAIFIREEGFTDDGVGYQMPMLWMPGNIEHLQESRSVLYPLVKRMNPDVAAYQWFCEHNPGQAPKNPTGMNHLQRT